MDAQELARRRSANAACVVLAPDGRGPGQAPASDRTLRRVGCGDAAAVGVRGHGWRIGALQRGHRCDPDRQVGARRARSRGGHWETAGGVRSSFNHRRLVAMIEPLRQEILTRLARLSELAPDMRFGQLIANLAFMAAGSWDQTLWDLEDNQLVEAIRQMESDLSQRTNEIGLTNG